MHQPLVTIFFIRVTKPPSIKFSSHVSSILQITISLRPKNIFSVYNREAPKKMFLFLKELFLDKEGRVQDSLFFVEFWQPFSVLKASRNAMKLVSKYWRGRYYLIISWWYDSKNIAKSYLDIVRFRTLGAVHKWSHHIETPPPPPCHHVIFWQPPSCKHKWWEELIRNKTAYSRSLMNILLAHLSFLCLGLKWPLKCV